MIWIAMGCAVIVGLMMTGVMAIAKDVGWRLTLTIWAISAAVTVVFAMAALAIGHGVEQLQ